ncbi:MAG TPA: hypothetical protein VHU18_07370 [Rhizomicrobium sp.]|jgi:hypothetical protein|nr:hypothetical protein [Rhizomicrobium sp.]
MRNRSPGHLSEARLGYRIHTNRELGMMLRHEKPLAVFCDVEDVFPAVLSRYLRLFDGHVQSGRLIKREYRETVDIRGACRTLLTIFYALPEESWRIDAMLELRRNTAGWTTEHERREGTLLGYTDAQNDAWIASRYPADNGAPERAASVDSQ